MRILQDDQEIVLTPQEAIELAEALRRWGFCQLNRHNLAEE